MKLNQNLGNILLAAYLIVVGLTQIISLSFTGLPILIAILAIATGVVIILGSRGAKLSANLGWLLLAIWLIATGVLAIVKINIPSQDVILAVLAIAAGVLLLLRR